MTSLAPATSTIDRLLGDARRSLDRVSPREARDAQRVGALLVDIRPEVNRATEGAIPGSLVIDRNVLEWRLDPTSDACLDVASFDAHIILFCNEGYASSFAAATLQEVGIRRATDLIGGYRAWRSLGLPIITA